MSKCAVILVFDSTLPKGILLYYYYDYDYDYLAQCPIFFVPINNY